MDHPIPMSRPKFETSVNMKTDVIILILTRDIWNIRKAVIIDSGFCILKGIFEMNTRGVYGSAFIKKNIY